MRIKLLNSTIIGVCSAIIAISCSEKMEIADPSIKSHQIGFLADGVVETRSGEVAIADPNYELFPVGAVFGVSAYNLPTSHFNPLANKPDLLYNAHVAKLDEKIYLYNPIANWPYYGKVKFVAYYPHSSTFPVGTLALSAQETAGLPTITLDLRNSKSKVDLSVASTEPLSPTIADDDPSWPTRTDHFVNFRFKRKLAELFFRAKAVNMPTNVNFFIHSITIKNVNRKGVYSIATDSWSNLEGMDALSGATLSLASTGVPIGKDDEFTDIINPGNTDGSNRDGAVVMIPSAYDNVKISMVYTLEYMNPSGGCEYRMTGARDVPFKVNWEASKTYTYDMELGFHEASGDDIQFTFTIKPWNNSNIDTGMN